jgi:membrane protease YdiL (CAAX protease family)
MVAALFGTEIPFVAVACFLRWRYQSTGHILPRLLQGHYLSAMLIGVGAGIAMAGFGVVHAIVSTSLFGSASTEAMEELMRAVFQSRGNLVAVSALVFSIAVLAPFCEEFFFRGVLFSSVRSTSSARTAAIASSLLFAVAHLNPAMFTYYVVFGLTMCWLLSKKQTIAAPIAAHITVNATATLGMLLGGQ